MRKWEITVEINAPIQVVWDCVTNFVDTPAWNLYVTKAHSLTMRPFGKGSVFAHERGFRQAILKIEEVDINTYLRLGIKINDIIGMME